MASHRFAIESDGKFYLPTGEFRPAKKGEAFLFPGNKVVRVEDKASHANPSIIMAEVHAPKVPTLELVMKMHKALYDELSHHYVERGITTHRSAVGEHLAWQRTECPWLDEPREKATTPIPNCQTRPGETVLPLTERQKANKLSSLAFTHNHPSPCNGEVS